MISSQVGLADIVDAQKKLSSPECKRKWIPETHAQIHGGPWSIVQMECQEELCRQSYPKEFFQEDLLKSEIYLLGGLSPTAI